MVGCSMFLLGGGVVVCVVFLQVAILNIPTNMSIVDVVTTLFRNCFHSFVSVSYSFFGCSHIVIQYIVNKYTHLTDFIC